MFMLNQIQARTEKALLTVMQLPVFTAQSSLRGLQTEFLRMCCLLVLCLNFCSFSWAPGCRTSSTA
jgi:hypothetical protein